MNYATTNREIPNATRAQYPIYMLLCQSWCGKLDYRGDFLRANRRHNIRFYPDDWKKLPIPNVPPEQQATIVALVDKILAAKRKGFERKVARIEKKLDEEVSQLYGL